MELALEFSVFIYELLRYAGKELLFWSFGTFYEFNSYAYSIHKYNM